ncbi:MAG: HEPN domain-containing protein [Clostridia bacterium]
MNSIDLVNYWFESADDDYETMRLLYNNKKNTWCLFIGHLVIEKILKGLYARNNPENPIAPKIHNLILLSQKANLEVPIEIREKIQIINTFNISARYDDYKKNFDKKCTEEYTREQVENIEVVKAWLKNQ